MSGISGAQQKLRRKRRLFDLYNGHCFYCLDKLTVHGEGSTQDHIIPKCRGGTNDIDNMVLCCWDCNNRRGARHAYRFLHSVSAGVVSIALAFEIMRTPENRLAFHRSRLAV